MTNDQTVLTGSAIGIETVTLSEATTAVVLDSYRAVVENAANNADGVEIVLNRSVEHACVVVEYLFRKADHLIEIVTQHLINTAYGTDATTGAALTFLRRSRDSRIDVLVEGSMETANKSNLISAIRGADLLKQVTMTSVPEAIQKTYMDHVIVVDGIHYRYQRSRKDLEAMVQFGNRRTGQRLHDEFLALKHKCA